MVFSTRGKKKKKKRRSWTSMLYRVLVLFLYASPNLTFFLFPLNYNKLKEMNLNSNSLNQFQTIPLNHILFRSCWGICYKIRKRSENATLRRDNTIFKVIIAPTLKEFCFRIKSNSPPGYNKVTNYRKQISVIPLKSIPTKLCI
jgi:hypothetical protein